MPIQLLDTITDEDFAIPYSGDNGEDGAIARHTLQAVHDLFTRTPDRVMAAWPEHRIQKIISR